MDTCDVLVVGGGPAGSTCAGEPQQNSTAFPAIPQGTDSMTLPASETRVMHRPTRFEHSRFLGDKRTQLVYDLEALFSEEYSKRSEGRGRAIVGESGV